MMAIVKLVEVLRRDLVQWNLWRRENPRELLLDLVRANLIGANLCEADLSGA
ncbi:MAG: pentapeptide repeat-containing protein, partial [Gemmatimonadaceae bacterium]|nr:pentapeptide repeat-containing protein [Gloeobacterales cyanobacterium ES-bin-141]